MKGHEMRDMINILKMTIKCVIALVGAAVSATIVPMVGLLLLAGPLLALAGVVGGLVLVISVVAIVFGSPATAIGGGMAVVAIVRDACN